MSEGGFAGLYILIVMVFAGIIGQAVGWEKAAGQPLLCKWIGEKIW